MPNVGGCCEGLALVFLQAIVGQASHRQLLVVWDARHGGEARPFPIGQAGGACLPVTQGLVFQKLLAKNYC